MIALKGLAPRSWKMHLPSYNLHAESKLFFGLWFCFFLSDTALDSYQQLALSHWAGCLI